MVDVELLEHIFSLAFLVEYHSASELYAAAAQFPRIDIVCFLRGKKFGATGAASRMRYYAHLHGGNHLPLRDHYSRSEERCRCPKLCRVLWVDKRWYYVWCNLKIEAK